MEGESSSSNTKNQRTQFRKLLNFFKNLFGKKTKEGFSTVISHIVEEYHKRGLVSFEEKKLYQNITSFSDKKISSVVTPRSDIVAIKHDADLEEVKEVIVKNGYTRVPVYKDNFDQIIGFIHSKDLVKFLCKEDSGFDISKILRKILLVPGSMKLMDVMLKMKVSRVHIAIVLDEFGGVDGFATIENVMEEIVGDIEDEHDIPSENAFFRIKEISENNFQLGGRVAIKKAEEILGVQIANEDDEFETIGGYVMSLFKTVPQIGEEITTEDFSIKIIDSDQRSIKLIEVLK
ncbi:MAG: HlyC/CorC family transporter [Rickettsiales bacterium]|nr:HlyC/CorC family transporter [Rickettsiales bacterium]